MSRAACREEQGDGEEKGQPPGSRHLDRQERAPDDREHACAIAANCASRNREANCASRNRQARYRWPSARRSSTCGTGRVLSADAIFAAALTASRARNTSSATERAALAGAIDDGQRPISHRRINATRNEPAAGFTAGKHAVGVDCFDR
jgi:hypothetical protein